MKLTTAQLVCLTSSQVCATVVALVVVVVVIVKAKFLTLSQDCATSNCQINSTLFLFYGQIWRKPLAIRKSENRSIIVFSVPIK